MKPSLIFRAPLLTASGYGVHSRQVFQALLAADIFDLYVMPTNWGNTGYITNDPIIDIVKNLEFKTEERNLSLGDAKFDVSIQLTIPNEFTNLANYNIGITAGIEVNVASPAWIQKCNEMNLIIVPSKHSKDVLCESKFKDNNGNILELKTQIEVASEGVDTRYFNSDKIELNEEDVKLPCDFNFLFVGLGLDKAVGEDRKDIGTLIKLFCEQFKGRSDVGLVLKTSIVNSSYLDFINTESRIQQIKKSVVGDDKLPNITLVHGRLSEEKLSRLFKHPQIKAFVSLTHGEGFGLPLLEAAACDLPVLATNWSGHLDFLSVNEKKKFIPLDFDMVDIPQSAVWEGVMENGSKWAKVKDEDVKNKLMKVKAAYDKPLEWAKELGVHVRQNCDIQKVCYELIELITSKLNISSNTSSNGSVKKDQFLDAITQLNNLSGSKKRLLYTMPMSAGDVFVSTGVVSSLRVKFPNHAIFFATEQKYSSILEENKDIDHVIPWQDWMMNIDVCNKLFDQVYTPNIGIQLMSSNWIHGGHGRLLAEEMANHCLVELDTPKIKLAECQLPDGNFIVVHPGSGKGQHEARNYHKWQEVVTNISKLSGLKVIQVGESEDIVLKDVVDMRGKTSYQQLAYVISKSSALVGIDSVSMHMAAALGVPHVSLFGSSYAKATGPAKPKSLSILLESPTRGGCDKACYKYQCAVDRDNPCINEIKPRDIVSQVARVLAETTRTTVMMNKMDEYKEINPTISGYTHLLNPSKHRFPWKESIGSMLGFCDEVVVVDGGSDDGSLEELKKMAEADSRLVIYDRQWDWNEPGMDGMQKAYARAMCTGEFLWQQDADEVVHECDYEKIKKLVTMFPSSISLLHLPVIELWGDSETVRTDRHSWKWRLSRSDFRITHGINKAARVIDEKTGKIFAKKGMSDGCEYVDIMTGEYIEHSGFYTAELERARKSDPQRYGKMMHEIMQKMPVVYHYSWADLPRKISNFKQFWDKCWANLYNDQSPQDRFPDVNSEEDVFSKALELKFQGGEHSSAPTFKLERSNPEIMKSWIEGIRSV